LAGGERKEENGEKGGKEEERGRKRERNKKGDEPFVIHQL